MNTVQPMSAPSPKPDQPGFRILVVDDNHESALSLAMMLSIMGHETRTANDGESAVTTAESFLPDVVLLDIGLPSSMATRLRSGFASRRGARRCS